MSNVYYNPEHFGLEIVAEIEYSSGCYEFDTRVVWKQKSSRKCFTARDSGCSCPTPFEDYHMGNIEPLNFQALRQEVNGELTKEWGSNITAEQAQDFLAKVRAAANKRLHLTGGESAPLQALSTSEHGSGLEADSTPPTSK